MVYNGLSKIFQRIFCIQYLLLTCVLTVDDKYVGHAIKFDTSFPALFYTIKEFL